MPPKASTARSSVGSVDTETEAGQQSMPRPRRPSTGRRAHLRRPFREAARFQMAEAWNWKLMLSTLPPVFAPSRAALCAPETHAGMNLPPKRPPADCCCAAAGVSDNRIRACSNTYTADARAVSHKTSSRAADPETTTTYSAAPPPPAEPGRVAHDRPLPPAAKHAAFHHVPSTMASGLKQVAASVRQNVSRLKYGKQAVDWKGRVWEDLENGSMGFNTQELMISCGTITVKDHPRHPQVLVIFNRELGIFQLPKGKKDIDESLPTTAVRETVEETGVLVEPLYLKFGTRFTCPEGWQIQRSGELVTDTDKAEEKQPEAPVSRAMTKDIVYSSAYVDPATQSFRYVFWYAATPAGGAAAPDDALRHAEDIGRLQPLWFPVEKAIGLLKMTVEKQAVATVRDYMAGMTPPDWELSRALAARDRQKASGNPPSPETRPGSPGEGPGGLGT